MARTSFGREEFDPGREYSVSNRRPIKVGYKTFAPGELFDRSTVTTRRLRQMYENGDLIMGGPMRQAPAPAAPKGPDLSVMSDSELRSWLVDHGVTPRINDNHDKLLARAQKVATAA